MDLLNNPKPYTPTSIPNRETVNSKILPLQTNTMTFPAPWSTQNGFELIQKNPLGKGSFGYVWKAHHRLDQIHYAIKEINVKKAMNIFRTRDQEADEKCLLSKLQREIDHHSRITGSFVVKYHSHWVEGPDYQNQKYNELCDLLGSELNINSGSTNMPDMNPSPSDDDDDNTQPQHNSMGSIYIQMELCNYIDLAKFLEGSTDLELQNEYPRIINQIAKGLSAIHSLGIIHRDLKPENIYCNQIEGRNPLIWKIGDFGLSIQANLINTEWNSVQEMENNLENMQVEMGSDYAPTYSSHDASFAGTDAYKSPEMYEKRGYNNKTDIYSLGLIYFQVLFKFRSVLAKRLLFFNLKDQSCTFTGATSSLPCIITGNPAEKSRYLDIIHETLHSNPDHRPDAQTIYNRTLYPLHFYMKSDVLPSNPHFQGRRKELEILENIILCKEKRPPFAVVTSSTGNQDFSIGKSSFVQHLLNNSKFSTWSKIWLDGSNRETIEKDLINLCSEIDVPYREEGPVQFIRDLKAIFTQVCTTLQTFYEPLIVLFDNISNELVESMVQELVTRNIFCVLITKDEYVLNLNYSKEAAVDLKMLEKEDCVTLLIKKLRNIGNTNEYQRLARLLKNNPTPILRAARVIKDREEKQSLMGYGVALYCKRLLTAGHQLATSNFMGIADGGNIMLYATVSASIDHLVRFYGNEDNGLYYADILKFLYYIYPSGVSLHNEKDILLIRFLATANNFCQHNSTAVKRILQEHVNKLLFFDIVAFDRNGRFSLTTPAYKVLVPSRETHQDIRRMFQALQDSMPIRSSQALILITVMEHLRVAPIQISRKIVKEFSTFMLKSYQSIRQMNSMIKGIPPVILTTYRLFRKVFGPRSQLTLSMGNWYATSLRDEGKLKTALKILDVLVKNSEIGLGPKHWLTVDVIHHKAVVYDHQGNYREAKKGYKRVIALIEVNDSSGNYKHNPDLPPYYMEIQVKHNLAMVLLNMEELDEANRLLQEVLQSYSKLNYSPTDVETVTAKKSLAQILYRQEKYAEAMEIQKEVLETEVRTWGEGRLLSLECKSMYASTLEKFDPSQIDRVIRIHQHVLAEYESTLGRNHPSSIGSRETLALCLLENGQLQKAKDLFHEVLALNIKIRGAQHHKTLETKWCIADTLSEMEKWEEAMYIHEEILHARIDVVGAENPKSLDSKHDIGICLLKLEQYEKAKDLFQEVASLRLKVLGKDNPKTLESQYYYADSLDKCGKSEEALNILKNVVEMENAIFGVDHSFDETRQKIQKICERMQKEESVNKL